MKDSGSGEWVEMLAQLNAVVGLTSKGEIAMLRTIRSAEDFIVTCLVAQFVAHRAGKAPSDSLTIDEMIAAGGLAYRPARQTIYNATSSLAKSRIIEKAGKAFRVGERTVLQFFVTKLPALTAAA